jgi:hypothetical protein
MVVDVDPGRPKSVAVFLSGGIIGWSLFGIVLFFAPANWIDPIIGAAFVCISAQYVAWWQLGGSMFLLWPIPLRLMGKVLGLPNFFSVVLVYAASAWFVVSAFERYALGVPPVSHHRHWIQAVGAAVILIGCIPWVAFAIRERFSGSQWVGTGPRSQRGRILRRIPLLRWAGQCSIAFGTLGAFLVLFARLA